MTRDLERGGRLLHDHVVDRTSKTRHAELRGRFVQAALRQKKLLPYARLGWSIAAAGLLAILWVVWPRHAVAPADLRFYVGLDDQRGHIGKYYSAPVTGELAVRFSDGSRVTLQRAGGIRVSRADVEQAVLLLEKGTAHVAVEHHDGRQWRVAAGPYTIHVTGTRFVVDWDNGSGKLEVRMQSGRVNVTGPGIESGVELRGTQRFVSQTKAWLEERTEPISPVDSEPPATESSAPAAAPAPSVPVGQPEARERRPSSAGSPASWSELVARGDYAALISAAESRGIDETMRTADAPQLSALADGARFTGHRSLARRALLALRSRFSGSERSTSAAFILGRLEDDAGNQAEALEWYDTYLSEGGPLVSEALGRKMIALQKLGRTEQAQRTARQYLERFGDGAYAAHARDMTR